MSKTGLVGTTKNLVLTCFQDQYKTFELVSIQIGCLEPDLWILEDSMTFYDVRRSLFTLSQKL